MRRMLVAALVGLSCHLAGAEPFPAVLGVLERHGPSRWVTAARMMFRADEGKWRAWPHQAESPEQLKSLVGGYPHGGKLLVMDGSRQVQSIQAVRPEAFTNYGQVGCYLVEDAEQLTPQGTSAAEVKEWSDWVWPSFRPFARPLPVCQALPKSLQWKPCAPPTDRALRCLSQAHPQKRGLRGKCRQGWDLGRQQSLALVDLDPKGPALADARGEEARRNCLVLLSPRGDRFLGASINPVAWADWDGDGHPELLCRTSLYNLDGYLLFWSADLSQKATFLYSYH